MGAQRSRRRRWAGAESAPWIVRRGSRGGSVGRPGSGRKDPFERLQASSEPAEGDFKAANTLFQGTDTLFDGAESRFDAADTIVETTNVRAKLRHVGANAGILGKEQAANHDQQSPQGADDPLRVAAGHPAMLSYTEHERKRRRGRG